MLLQQTARRKIFVVVIKILTQSSQFSNDVILKKEWILYTGNRSQHHI